MNPVPGADEGARSASASKPPRGRLFRKYAGSFVAVVTIALAANGLSSIWFAFYEQKRLLVEIQREQAKSAATEIRQFVKEIEHQMGWLTQGPRISGTLEDMRLDAVRLLRQAPSIVEIGQLDDTGHEQVRVSRTARDTLGSQADFSDQPAFREARANGVYYGPVYFVQGSEPYMTIAVAGARRGSGVSVAEVNLKFIWGLVSQVKVGSTGRAYVVDGDGRLIAHPDLRQVLRHLDLSQSAQVTAARAASPGGDRSDGIVAPDIESRMALSVSAPVDPLGWRVFIELPLQEAYAPVYSSMVIAGALLVGALGCAVLAGLLLSRRMVVPIQALNAGAARIGGGDFGQRLSIRTDDELEALGDQFNRMAGHLQESYALLERKVAERTAELARARDQAVVAHGEAERARQAAELANQTKSRFLAVVSHEIRTPMNGVMGVFQLLDRKRLSAAHRRLLEMATASGETLLALIDAILDYARLETRTEALEPRDFDLRNLIEAAVGLLRPQAERKGLRLDLVMTMDPASEVHGDPVRLNRVLLNLLGNAIKFTETGGIALTASLTAIAERRMRLDLSVSDTGIGIAPHMLERIFEDFVQADDTIVRQFGGTGLGLAISRRLAALMGGELTVESRQREGSRFHLAVPLQPGQHARPADTASAMPRTLAVLVVDDDPINREVARALLARHGCVAALAADPLTAIEMARTGDFDLVLMDLHMPSMDGVEAAARIRALPLARQPQIVALTADVSAESRRRLARGGIHTILRKPLLDHALREVLIGVADPKSDAALAFDPDGLVDEGFLQHQRGLLGPARLVELELVFRSSTGELIATLEKARDPLDRMAISRCAHTLGGAAAVLGLGRLFARAGVIETSAATAPPDVLLAAVTDLVAVRRDSIAALARAQQDVDAGFA